MNCVYRIDNPASHAPADAVKDPADYDGSKFMKVNGTVATHVNGLCKNLTTGTWYFFANDQVQDYTVSSSTRGHSSILLRACWMPD